MKFPHCELATLCIWKLKKRKEEVAASEKKKAAKACFNLVGNVANSTILTHLRPSEFTKFDFT